MGKLYLNLGGVLERWGSSWYGLTVDQIWVKEKAYYIL